MRRIFLGIEDLTPSAIIEWVEQYRYGAHNTELSPHGKNNYYTAIKWYLARATLIKYPKEELKKIKKVPVRPKDRSVDDLALEHILQFSPNTTFELAFRLIRERGIMPHELLSIRVKDVSKSEEGYAVVSLPAENPEVPSRRNKTGPRIIIFVRNAARILELARVVGAGTGPEGRLFPWRHGVLSVIFCRMKKMQEEVARREGWNNLYRGRLYDLRHAAITEMYVHGFVDQEVRAMVGWAPSSKMPDIYVHIGTKHLLDACKRNETNYINIESNKRNLGLKETHFGTFNKIVNNSKLYRKFPDNANEINFYIK